MSGDLAYTLEANRTKMIARDRQKQEAETWKWSEETGLPLEEAERLNAERYAKFNEDGKENGWGNGGLFVKLPKGTDLNMNDMSIV